MNNPLVSHQTFPEFWAEFQRYAQSRLEPPQLASLLGLAERYFSHYPLDELRGRALGDVFGSLYQSWRFLQHFEGSGPQIQLYNPDLAQHGWLSPHTLLMVLQKDMPFLVDSIRIELNRRNIAIYVMKSTVLTVERDSAGTLLSLIPGDSSTKEALVVMEISLHSQQADRDLIRDSLVEVLRELEQVVADYPAMRTAALALVDNLRRQTQAPAAAVIAETCEFIEWLADDHFTFLGYREYEFVEQDGRRYLQENTQARLGSFALRDPCLNQVAVDEFSEGSVRFHVVPQAIAFSKAPGRARIHRSAYADYLAVKRFDEQGNVIGEARLLGLYTSEAYLLSPWQIPLIRAKVTKVFELSGLDPNTHDGKNFRRLLETFPRNELFLSSSTELFQTLTTVAQINERAMVRLLMRRDLFGNFVNFLVYLPRDNFSTRIRLSIQELIGKALGTQDCEFNSYLSESVLARLYLVFNVEGIALGDIDLSALEAGIINITRTWDDHLRTALLDTYGEEPGNRLLQDFRQGFSAAYQDSFDARVAAQDLHAVVSLSAQNPIAIQLYQPLGCAEHQCQFKLFHYAHGLALSDVIPVLENLGFRVESESSYDISRCSGERVWLHDFRLSLNQQQALDVAAIRQPVTDAFIAIWHRQASNDSFNKLIALAQLDWRQVVVLRAYASYMHQTLFPFAESYIASALQHNWRLVRQLLAFFQCKFDPAYSCADRGATLEALREQLLAALDKVENLSEDRILRRYLVLMEYTLRTNYFQCDQQQQPKAYLSFKFSPRHIPDIPEPRPLFEIFVFSAHMEAVHLRTSKVARGGLRWSDRLQDYRTEILGLVKAQQVKNAVIVPSGAKGGFVCKQMPANADREAILAEAIRCYQTMIRGMLDLTDNYCQGELVSPVQILAYDEPDPYLVVAADKGTASFSDIANQISADYGHWLGDAFASGGSQGYDHKGMGITARGAWISVQRHFREQGVDVQRESIRVVGIGDMAGDVFGNGMLLSRAIKLVAAFNHQHIFIDPTPDPETSFLERQRLFTTPKTTWADYNRQFISAGGDIFSRSAKSIALSAQLRELLMLDTPTLTPNELIHALLQAPVDLIWNGGIGTYVKASHETHAEVGDKANDNLRVNGNELRCKVFGEGGNLGMTQRGRVEYCLKGGNCNTDFIDNAAGVDCSDHEVNIKILLNILVAQGDLTTKQRNQLLVAMTDSVAELVLHNNTRQTLAISVAQQDALKRSAEYRRFINALQNQGRLNRALEFLPEDDALLERQAKGTGLTRPELALLISYAKALLKDELSHSDLAEDNYLVTFVDSAFPAVIGEGYREVMHQHPLRREILATQLANDMVNTMGISFALRLQESTGAGLVDIAKAYVIARDIYTLPELLSALDRIVLEPALQWRLINNMMRKVRRATRWFLRNRRGNLDVAAEVAYFAPALQQLALDLPKYVGSELLLEWQSQVDELQRAGLPDRLVHRLAQPADLYSGLSVVEAARVTQLPVSELGHAYFAIGDHLNLPWFYGQIANIPVDNVWQAMARETCLGDLESQLRSLSISLMQCSTDQQDGTLLMTQRIERWSTAHQRLVTRWQQMIMELQSINAPDFAIFSVALRELLDLAQVSQHCK
ncbi:NAD-glutamate dehydrogenase [Cellvibrio japonicus]|uniref:NAD-specific glutamate dehydrogenase n=1 Tax=Cellvibrio japonicus (strain Ueda107) TaxID=498211 RepID=B3PIM1_CELJU|nr:NAD-glutamate dehydrogenase [Cellvibrio japonicus]ACE86291.1 NAD-specific glutamate dehydrogenase [Cellvibrio japonicus Ueda107]QEI12614.1 NAD-glutamate dehydrogenase [Cellvibrio japonicus]QEI16188.1 NAD-glutamate dehydrogenase [Cellvibrio japonicus]QEI19766.1 NAD-glutamate dehydrogenase [Cellvibrio japonicus]